MSEFDYTYEERQRDVDAKLYSRFFVDDVIDDLSVSIGDETDDVITVTCALVDPNGDNIARSSVIRLIFFTDENYDTVVSTALTDDNIAIAATTGTMLPVGYGGVLGKDVYFATDADGDLVITFTDETAQGAGVQNFFLGFFLPNNQFVAGGEIQFVNEGA